MFVREKRINGYSYLYLVESVREDGRSKQRIIKNLGRKEVVLADGDLDRLAASIARYSDRASVLAQLAAGNPDGLSCKRLGAPLLFGRLWQESGIAAVLEELLTGLFEVARADGELNPAEVDYLYFVADGSGGHAFARTLAEHNRNVATWRRIKNGEQRRPVEPSPPSAFLYEGGC